MIFHNFCDTVSTPVVEGQPGQTAETVDQRACPHFKSLAMLRECATMPDNTNLQPANLQAATPRMLSGAPGIHCMTADWKHRHRNG
jgi:hypothetical protein